MRRRNKGNLVQVFWDEIGFNPLKRLHELRKEMAPRDEAALLLKLVDKYVPNLKPIDAPSPEPDTDERNMRLIELCIQYNRPIPDGLKGAYIAYQDMKKQEAIEEAHRKASVTPAIECVTPEVVD